MRPALACLSAMIFAGTTLGFTMQEKSQEKAKDNPPPVAESAKAPAADKKNPVAVTPEGLAAAKKMFGYDCAMCHGASGDGKGDMVESMSLSMKDWRDAGSLSGMSDAEIFDIISKGKGKMTGEGDRLPPERVWSMVNYVRSLAKKGAAATADSAPKK